MDKNIYKIQPQETDIISLYLGDYSKTLHVREIARLLNANHRTISLALQELEKKQIMISNTIGKNKEYKLNINNISTREYIRLSEIIKHLQLIEKHPFLKKFMKNFDFSNTPILLFGSYAKGIEKKDSDIDLVIFTDVKLKTGTEKRIKEFFDTYNKKVQIQKANRNDFEKGLREKDPLILEITEKHIIVNNCAFFIGMLWRYAHEK
ncbi:MAG: nucleotidyltransferase domain-containing protein [Nanoarchaeota archaeon]|nr:nucleotidyltransferase domain-containing protein [Nanoarchaeota archaeon]